MHDGPCPPRASGRESAPAIRDHSKNSTQRDSPDHRDKASSGTVFGGFGLRERVKAGMDRTRKQGKRIGRPRVTDRRGFSRRFGAILERVSAGDLSRRQAARELNIGYATLKRLLDAEGIGGAGGG